MPPKQKASASASSSTSTTCSESSREYIASLVQKSRHKKGASQEPPSENSRSHKNSRNTKHQHKKGHYIPHDKLMKCYSSFKEAIQQIHIEHRLKLKRIDDEEYFSPEHLSRIEHLHIYDFDGTLYETLTPEDGVPIYESVMGESWPHGKKWWAAQESISAFTRLVDGDNQPIVKEGEALEHYLAIRKSQKATDMVMLMTGRKNALKRVVIDFLNHRLPHANFLPEIMCFKPDEINNTIRFKIHHLYMFCNSLPNLKQLTIWEDRVEHATQFEKLPIKNFTLGTNVTINVQLVGKEANGSQSMMEE